MAKTSVNEIIDKLSHLPIFPVKRIERNITDARIIMRLFIHYAFMAAMNGYVITSRSEAQHLRFRLRLIMEKPRPLNDFEKKIYVQSYKKFGYIFRLEFYGNHVAGKLFDFIPEPGMMADLQDIVNSNTIYKLTHEKSFN